MNPTLRSKLHEEWPNERCYLYYRGSTRQLMGDAAGAIGDLEPCLDAPVYGRGARLYLGRALIAARRSEEALVHFTTLLAQKGDLTKEALDGVLGVAYMRATGKKSREALELYDQALARDPQNLWARIGQPLCYKTLGDLDAAIRAYEAGLAALPDEPQLLNDYGLLLHARGDKAAAKQLFERALGAGSADGGENLGIFALRDERDWRAAADYFARALAIDASRPRLRFYRELCLAELAGAPTSGAR